MSVGMFAVSAVVVLAVMFAFAAGWHLVVFKDLYARLAIYTRAEPIIPLGLISMLLQALIFAYLFPIFAAGKPPILAGLGFGLLMGVLMGSIGALAEAGKQNVTSLSTFLTLESAFYAIQYTVVGLVIGGVTAWFGGA
jgi:hypothetical protein